MATLNLVLDKRVLLKNNQYNLSIRVINGKTQVYLRLSKMTEEQYREIFLKNNLTKGYVEFREDCNKQVTRVERILSDMKIFNAKELKTRFNNDEEIVTNKDANEYESLKLGDWFDLYIVKSSHLKYRTKRHFQYSKNVFTKNNPDMLITEITKDYLEKFEISRIREGNKITAINSNIRDLRTVVNFFRRTSPSLSSNYKYPFGQGGFTIGNFYPKKLVMSNDELRKVIAFKDFQNKEEEYAKDIWELLYRFNGINYADLLQMRWSHRNGNYFVFFRKKTETTRKSNRQEIIVPINEKVQALLDKVGNKDSKFVLGLLKENYTEAYYDYVSRKERKKINKNLGRISEKLNLSVKLKLQTARDTYATVLKRKGVSRDLISEMLNHSNPMVTSHYLASLDMEKTFEINDHLI